MPFKNNNLLIIVTIFLITQAGQLFATSFTEFESITTKDGLSRTTVFDITQIDTGFIWLGTQQGLNRFDGYEFK